MLGDHVSMVNALKVTFLSMSIVFATLYVISKILDLFKVVFYERDLKKEAAMADSNIQEEMLPLNSLKEETDLVAALMAVVLASNNVQNKKLHIKSIKRVA